MNAVTTNGSVAMNDSVTVGWSQTLGHQPRNRDAASPNPQNRMNPVTTNAGY